ncbi:MAG: hypothetical protein AAGA88_14505 [Pseudomonadota bacterium]
MPSAETVQKQVDADIADPSRYEGTAVNPRTFLATDYLNHFNEAVMLLELAGDMPECIEDLKFWAPKSYIAHFEDSVFKDRHLCIEAYEFVAPEMMARFNDVIARLDTGVLEARDTLNAVAEAGDPEQMRYMSTSFTVPLRTLIDEASGIINGVDNASLGETASEPEHIDATQATIDALFD